MGDAEQVSGSRFAGFGGRFVGTAVERIFRAFEIPEIDGGVSASGEQTGSPRLALYRTLHQDWIPPIIF